LLETLKVSGLTTEDLGFTKKDEAILASKDPDFSKLSSDAQWILFLADKVNHPTFVLDKLVDGTLSYEEAYIKYHWAGNERGNNPNGEAAARKNWKEAHKRLGIPLP
jgi:hypothetical protein